MTPISGMMAAKKRNRTLVPMRLNRGVSGMGTRGLVHTQAMLWRHGYLCHRTKCPSAALYSKENECHSGHVYVGNQREKTSLKEIISTIFDLNPGIFARFSAIL